MFFFIILFLYSMNLSTIYSLPFPLTPYGTLSLPFNLSLYLSISLFLFAFFLALPYLGWNFKNLICILLFSQSRIEYEIPEWCVVLVEEIVSRIGQHQWVQLRICLTPDVFIPHVFKPTPKHAYCNCFWATTHTWPLLE